MTKKVNFNDIKETIKSYLFNEDEITLNYENF
jgi:hypothetical protein